MHPPNPVRISGRHPARPNDYGPARHPNAEPRRPVPLRYSVGGELTNIVG